jgi:hypothetical protein
MLVSYRCIHDKKVLGVCGETELANSKQSIITVMQASLFLDL